MLHCAGSVTDVSEDSNAYTFLDRLTLKMEALRSPRNVGKYQLKRVNITENFNLLKKNMSWVATSTQVFDHLDTGFSWFPCVYK